MPFSRPRQPGPRADGGHHVQFASHVVASADQISCELTDEAVVLGLTDGVYYGLNAVALRVWRMIQTPTGVAEVKEQLLREYDVDEERCVSELLELLEQLREWGLVSVIGENLGTSGQAGGRAGKGEPGSTRPIRDTRDSTRNLS